MNTLDYTDSIIIGLETHVELNTKYKLFCKCHRAEGDVPINNNVCPICLGHPGSIPYLSSEAVDKAAQFALSLGMILNPINPFLRKHYLYFDLPKGYQNTQKYYATQGVIYYRKDNITINTPLISIPIAKVILEENPAAQVGKVIDFNRSGAPLLEVVTDPIFSNKEEVGLYLEALRDHLLCLKLTNPDLNFKSDVNVSIVRTFVNNSIPSIRGTRAELKNLGSIKDIKLAIDSEVTQQIASGPLNEEGFR